MMIKNLPWAISRWVWHCLQVAQKPFGVNCSMTNSKYRTKPSPWGETLSGVKLMGGNSISAGDSRRWKIWGCWRVNAWTAAVKHAHFANSYLFFKYLFQAAWVRPLCMLIGGGVIPFAAVIGQWWITIPSFGCLPPPTPPYKGRRRVDLEEETTVETST